MLASATEAVRATGAGCASKEFQRVTFGACFWWPIAQT